MDTRRERWNDLKALADRYVQDNGGDQMKGLAALGEDLCKIADDRQGGGWLTLILRLQELSG